MTSNPTTQTHYYWLTINGTDFKDYFVTDSDALYEYTPLPAKIVLADGDIFHITNCCATLDRVDDEDED